MSTEEKRQKRRYNQSCEACRRSKKRCEGRDKAGNSLCVYCHKHGLVCTFPLSGEKSKLEAALSRGDQLDTFVARLAASTPEERDERLQEFLRNKENVVSPRATASPPTKRRRLGDLPPMRASVSGHTAATDDSGEAGSPRQYRRVNSLEDVHDLPGTAGLLTLAVMASEPSTGLRGSTLPRWLDYCIQTLDKAGLAAGFEPVQLDAILESFFSFHNPRFRYIDRSLFMCSVQKGTGRFCSPFLLAAILAFTLKYAPSWAHRMEEVCARAHMLLAQELAEPLKITTLQGLLVLANYHANLRRRPLCSQCIRLATSLIGDFEDRWDSLPAEEQSLVQQLRWSAYTMTVYLNMTFVIDTPNLARRPLQPLMATATLATESEVWKPAWLPGEPPGSSPCSLQPAYEHATFEQVCHFLVILDDILRSVYHRQPGESVSQTVFIELRERLQTAADDVPAHLHIDCSINPWPCPPLHVLYLNMLIRVCWLLLYQPRAAEAFGSTPPDSQRVLKDLASEVHALFETGYAHYPSRLSFLFIYGVFSGAAIDLERLRSSHPGTVATDVERAAISKRLSNTLNALQTCRQYIIGIDSSVTLLKKHRDAALGEQPPRSPLRAAAVRNGDGHAPSQENLNWLLNWTNGTHAAHNQHAHVPHTPLSAAGPPNFAQHDNTGPSLSGTDMNEQLASFLREIVGDEVRP